MVGKIAKYKLPKSEEALAALAHSVLTYAAPYLEGASAGRAGGKRKKVFYTA